MPAAIAADPEVPRRKVLCLFPKYASSFATFYHSFKLFPFIKSFMPPYGLLIIAAYLPRAWEVRFIDENIAPARAEDLHWADVVLVSGMHAQREQLHEVAARVRLYGKVSVLGGPSVTAAPEYYDDYDILHLGELGDATDAMIAALDASVARLPTQRVFKTQVRLPLDDFPLPAYHLIPTYRYMMLPIQWSSGCPYSCEFCDIPEIYGRIPRYKSAARLLAELDLLAKQDFLGAVFFVDDNLVGNKTALRHVLPQIVTWQRQNGYKLRFIGECTLNVAADPVVLQQLRDARFTDLYFGIESPETDALIAIDKKHNLRMPLKTAIATIHSYGLGVHAGFIIGLDTDTPDTADKILQFVHENNIPMPIVNLLYAPPKTELRRRLEREGRILPAAQATSSNVQFKEPNELVYARWRSLTTAAYAPHGAFRRFRHQAQYTYGNRLPAKLVRSHLTWRTLCSGIVAIVMMFYHLGLRSSYKQPFWSLTFTLLRRGQLESLLYVSMGIYHLAQFREEVLAGQAQPCIHSENPAPVSTMVQLGKQRGPAQKAA